MAVSSLASSSLLNWASKSPLSLSSSTHKNIKCGEWRCFGGKRLEVQQINCIHGSSGRLHWSSNVKLCSRRRWVPFAAIDDKASCNESVSVDTDLEKLHVVAKEEEQEDSDDDDDDDEEEEEEDKEEDSFSNDTSNMYVSGQRTEGKPGFITFHGFRYRRPSSEILVSVPSKETSRIFWFIGPTVLVAFLVLPSLYLRSIFSTVFEDSLLTDFLILFFTEALFYGGVAIFLLLIDRVWRPLHQVQAEPKTYVWSKLKLGFRISSVATFVLSLIIPLVTMGMVWPWTGPAASATLAPYLVGLVVQFAFEQYARFRRSPAWSVIPVIFQVYRLHQLNRAAQLVTALSFSVRGAEMTPQILAINSSLGTLLSVLQILGVICIWSLSSFLMRFLPASRVIPDS
ncbi:Cytochrome C oxidase subunit II transmembrane domain-containing protein [Dioscorea alata]|uniref:Cytochrome C oxidase subunit II transmembrane domain-containing protein n=1 Tax=Dioscorea alata TaxID=55571 RepID=A0ACB7UF52_DIOAL|nr:Cytochrome C oxidase subunit II transmembrane domain-containing protein [Dioscorea alata]